MKALSDDYLLLKKIGRHVDELLESMPTPEGVRMDEVYAYVRRRQILPRWIDDGAAFSHFMRKMHDGHNGVFRAFIPNCTVDTSIGHHYKWHFYPKFRTLDASRGIGKPPRTMNDFFVENKLYQATNGVRVRSKQELHILNRLVEVPHFEVYYERELTAGRDSRFPDFTIRNRRTSTVFYWEHFGLVEEEEYFKEMQVKMQWYKRIGVGHIEGGGRLIVTTFRDARRFVQLVDAMIRRMEEVVVPVGFLREV